MASLTIRNAFKNYGVVEVLKGIELEAKQGEFVALVGPSGCGKSTLLAMIAGLESVTGGEIWIGERMVNSVAPKDRDIAMVFQSYALYPTMTVKQNMLFGMEARRIPKAEQREAIERVSNLLQIGALLNRKPGQLSGGQRQRVAMGRALVRDPQLFLFDEPLSNLDAKLRVEMRTEIKKLHQRVGQTTIYVTHDQVEAMTLASRIAVMHQGQVQQFDQPQIVYDRPANMFVAGFMGSPSMNFLPAQLVDDGGQPAIVIRTGTGASDKLPLPDGAAARASGADVILGIRPEHLFRYDAELKARRPRLASLDTAVEIVEPTGAETMAVLRIGETEVIGRFESDGAPHTGEQFKLGLDMSHACLFEPSTQRLI